MSVLEVQDLTVSFSDHEVVHRVSFTVAAGEKLGIVGESGSGKSVTALSIMQLLSGASVTGRITLDGIDLLSLKRLQLDQIRGGRIAMIYQDPMSSLNPVHRIGHQLIETLELHTELSREQARSRAVDLLDEVGIPDPSSRMSAYPHELSGGMRQRVMIAMALCGEPDVLIADEPTTALDVSTQAKILDLLDDIVARRGTSVVLITHDLGIAAGFCDRIAVMRHGELVEVGPAEKVFDTPEHPYTKALIAAVVDLSTDVDAPLPVAGDDQPSTGSVGRWHGSQPETAPVLEVQGLSKTFGRRARRFHAVKSVGFSVRRGETFGIVGESGSGKSTTARAVLRLIGVDAGSVVFDGVETTSLRGSRLRALRQRMQVVLQDPFSALNRRHTVAEIIAAPLRAHRKYDRKTARREIESMLDLVGLDLSFSSRTPGELSGGQCQRVAIARSLILRPDFLVLDEAVSALDVSVQAQILNLLRRLQVELGLTYLFVSHDLGVVRYMCDHVAVMKSGEIVEQGTRDAIFEHPSHPYTQELLQLAPVADPALERARRSQRQGV